MNSKITFLFCLFLMTSTTLFAQTEIDSGLVAKYYFNGNALDESGNENNAIIHGATLTSDRFSDEDSAYEITGNTGTNGSDKFIEIPNVIDGFDNLTISLWVKQNDYASTPYGETYISYGTLPAMGWASTSIYYDKESSRIVFIVMTEKNRYTCMAPFSDSWIGTFQHFALVYDSEKGILKGYHNGANIATNENVSGKVYALGDYAGIGKHWWANAQGHSTRINGIFDDVRVYNRALAPDEITNLCFEKKCVETIYKKVVIKDTITIHDTIYAVIPEYVSVTDTLIIKVQFTGTNDNAETLENVIRIYPNPTKDIIYINTGEDYASMKDYKLRIIDAVGNIIFENKMESQSYSINLNSFGNKGLYFVTIIDDKNKVVDVRKILLE